jgi:hypothetical protein
VAVEFGEFFNTLRTAVGRCSAFHRRFATYVPAFVRLAFI